MRDFKVDENIKKEKTSYQFNHNLLLISLIILIVIGSTYYWADERNEFFEPFWMLVLSIWYVMIGVSLFLVFRKMKMGYGMAGILAWITIAFWMFDNFHIVFEISLIASKPNLFIVIKNFTGVIIAGFAIFSSHNAFHKI
tara:strand:+ start:109 stop:528 length:420 start_codon:yes stop_codon:yes gene_type:complete